MTTQFLQPVASSFHTRRHLKVQVDLQTRNPWNLPNWRDASQYPSVDDSSYGCWHWEFLRRRADYRALWLDYQHNKELWDKPPYEKQFLENGRVEYKKKEGAPLTRTQREAARFRLESLYSPACRYYLFLDAAQRFPACRLPPNPELPADEICSVMPAFHGDMSAFCSRAAHKGQFLISITPTFDLNAQWRYIRDNIERLNSEWNDGAEPKEYEWKATNWRRYLRVLDAKDKTSPHYATWPEIAKVFQSEPGTKTAHKHGVRDWFKQARTVQNKFLIARPLQNGVGTS